MVSHTAGTPSLDFLNRENAMRLLHPRPSVRAAFFASTARLGAAVCLAQNAAPAPPAKKAQTAKEAFKNIQVLGDLPADQLMPVMQQWSAALNVRCGFCHVVQQDAAGFHPDFASDAKPAKGMARQMVRMTADINAREKVVAGRITCYTCHQGHAEPPKAPPAGAEGPRPAPPAPAPPPPPR